MGDINYRLAPAAILLEHPGLTLEQLATRLNRLDLYRSVLKHARARFDFTLGFSENSGGFHGGILQLCFGVLGLQTRMSSKEARKLKIRPNFSHNQWKPPTYRLIHPRSRYDFGVIKEVEGIFPSALGVGDVYVFPKLNIWLRKRFQSGERLEEERRDMINGQEHAKFRVLEIKDLVQTTTAEQNIPSDKVQTIYKARLSIEELIPVYPFEDFSSLRELITNYPQYAPEKMFDLSKTRGKFVNVLNYLGEVYWFQENGKYYLDLNAALDSSRENYSSIVLTAEAIRRRDWDFLSYQPGRTYTYALRKFVNGSRRTLTRHTAAVALFWDCKNARDQEMTTTEWLEQRAIEQWRKGPTQTQIESEARILAEIVREEWKGLRKKSTKQPPIEEGLLF